MISNNRADLIKRLNRIKGQVEGILRMVDRGKTEIDIFTQITAAKKALDSTGRNILEKYIEDNLGSLSRTKEGKDRIRQILEVMEKI